MMIKSFPNVQKWTPKKSSNLHLTIKKCRFKPCLWEKYIFMLREWKDRCSGHESDLSFSYQTMIFWTTFFVWAVSSETRPSCWRPEALSASAQHHPRYTLTVRFLRYAAEPRSHGAMIQLLIKPLRADNDLFQSRNAYLTEQLIIVKHLECWSGGKSLHILAPRELADIRSLHGHADIHVLRGASLKRRSR